MAEHSGDAALVHQTLHGYRHGHELLASSTSIPDDAADLMARFSDSAPNARASDGPYLTGYPLPDGRYVVARTWPVTAAQRPNTVVTRSLILPSGTPPRFTAQGILDVLAAPADLDASATLRPIDLAEMRGAALGLSPSEAEVAARFYRSNQRLGFSDPVGRDRIVLGIWKQLWRSARYGLYFCTAPDVDRFSDRRRSVRFASGPDEESAALHGSPAIDLIIDDLISPGQFRDFLHVVGAGERAVGLVEPFADAFLLLQEPKEASVQCLVDWLQQHHGLEPRRLRRLKRRFLGFDDDLPRWRVDPFDVLGELIGGELGRATYASDSSLDQWIRTCWYADPQRTVRALDGANADAPADAERPVTAAQGLTEAFSTVASRLITPGTLALATRLNPDAALGAVLDRDDPDLWRAWAELDDKQRGVRAGEVEVHDWTIAVRALRENADWMSRLVRRFPASLDALVGQASKQPLPTDGLIGLTAEAKRSIRDRLEVADPELLGLARLADDAVLPRRLDVDAWRGLLKRNDDAALCVGYLISRDASQDHWEVATTAMAELYARLGREPAPEVWRRLDPHLRGDRTSWDRCKRLAVDFASVVRRYDDEVKSKTVHKLTRLNGAAANALDEALRPSKSKKFNLFDPATWL